MAIQLKTTCATQMLWSVFGSIYDTIHTQRTILYIAWQYYCRKIDFIILPLFPFIQSIYCWYTYVPLYSKYHSIVILCWTECNREKEIERDKESINCINNTQICFLPAPPTPYPRNRSNIFQFLQSKEINVERIEFTL